MFAFSPIGIDHRSSFQHSIRAMAHPPQKSGYYAPPPSAGCRRLSAAAFSLLASSVFFLGKTEEALFHPEWPPSSGLCRPPPLPTQIRSESKPSRHCRHIPSPDRRSELPLASDLVVAPEPLRPCSCHPNASPDLPLLSPPSDPARSRHPDAAVDGITVSGGVLYCSGPTPPLP